MLNIAFHIKWIEFDQIVNSNNTFDHSKEIPLINPRDL
jgi:hypothetical protein